jgi:hypothetical protein
MNNIHEVDFNQYCPKCAYYALSEEEDPCFDCLNESFTIDSHKPLYFEEDKNNANEK